MKQSVSTIQLVVFQISLKKGFETDLFLLCELKPNPALPKTHFCDARTISKFYWPCENLSTVFTR